MGNIWTKLSDLAFWSKAPFLKILMLGLDAAGKTTIMYSLKLGATVHTIPTLGFNVESIEYKRIRFTMWDIGGQERIRALWRHYFPNTCALIYVVDSADSERFDEAKDELWKMIAGEPDLKDAVLLVFANKQDLPSAVKPSKLSEILGLNTIKDRKWHIQGSNAGNGEGLYEGLDWLENALKQK